VLTVKASTLVSSSVIGASDNALGPIAEVTQIRLCCVAGAVPVMNRPGAKRSPDVGASSALNRTGRKAKAVSNMCHLCSVASTRNWFPRTEMGLRLRPYLKEATGRAIELELDQSPIGFSGLRPNSS
jgi:hypothetical protein